MTQATGKWRKSSRSGGGQSNGCVEARLNGLQPQLSDSQHVGTRPIMDVTVDDYLGFINTVKATR